MTSYPLTGPFTNAAAPGVSATFLNNVETWLGYAADSNITSDGNGNLSIVSTGFYKIGGFNVINSPSAQNLNINVPNVGGGKKLFIQVGGVNKASIDANGNLIIAGGLTQNGTP